MSEQISTAVILAARRENDGRLPYPLVSIADGIRLLDRTLSLLMNLAYERIYMLRVMSLNFLNRML